MKTMHNDKQIKKQYTNWLDAVQEVDVTTAFNVKRDLIVRLDNAERIMNANWLLDPQSHDVKQQMKSMLHQMAQIRTALE
jgi:phosphoenolpyruvate carboxylase